MKHLLFFLLLIGCFSALFSGILSHIIYYHEQHQLFLFSDIYFRQHLNLPGGLLDYYTAFVVQVFYHPIAGGVLFAMLIASVYLLSNAIGTLVSGRPDSLQLSLLPALYLFTQYVSIEFPVSVAIGILINQLVLLPYLYLPRKWQWIAAAPLLLGIYVVTGFYAILFMLGIVIYEILNVNKQTKYVIPLLLLLALVIVYWGSAFYAIPLRMALIGSLSDYIWAVCALVLLCLFPIVTARYINIFLPTKHLPIYILTGCLLACYLLGTTWLFASRYDHRVRLMIQADQHVKEQDWAAVLETTSQYEGKNHLVNYLTNLALYHTGQMPDRLFDYPQQWGIESLFFQWTGNSRESEYGNLLFADLGYLNEAHRWSFEAMTVFGETAPILQKVVVYNIANNRPLVARRFINLLKQSLFYRNWAIRMEQQMDSPQQFPLHRVQPDPQQSARFANFLNIGSDLQYLCKLEPGNQMAFEYLMSYYLLSNRVIDFAEDLWRIKAFAYPKLPKTYEEALLIYKLGVSEETFAQIGIDVDPATLARFERYYQLLSYKGAERQARLKKDYGNTYWYYMHFESPYGNKIVETTKTNPER